MREAPADRDTPRAVVAVPARLPTEPSDREGVDVNLALGAIESVLMTICDVAVIFSHDTDLLPVPETLARLAGTGAVETASWVSLASRKRLRPKPAVYHHEVSAAVFQRVETRVNYAHVS
jgi:hypothetical protein